LLALVFIAIDEHGDVSNELQVVAKVFGNLHGRFHFLDIGLQDAVQHFVGRQRVRVLLIWTQFGTGGFLDRGAGDQFPFAVYVLGKLVDHKFGDIGNDGEAAGHIAVKCAVADGDFGFVAGAEDHGAKFIRKGHQVVAANAGLDIFFRGVDRAIAEDRLEGLNISIEYGADRHSKKFNAEIVGQALGVGLAAFGGVGAGHGDAEDIFLAEGVHGDGGDDGGVHSPAEADDCFAEIAFADVVSGAGDDRLVGVGDFFLGLRVDIAFAGDRVEEDEVFFEGFGLRGDVAVGGEGHAGAVEDERIVAADLVDVDDRPAVLLGDGAKHFDAQGALVDGVGRGGNIQKDAGSLLDELGDGVAGVAGLGPEILVVPDVFADGDAQLFVTEAINVIPFARLEVAGFVEDVVGGQEHLALLEDDAAVLDEGGFVGDSLAGAGMIDAARKAYDGGERHAVGDVFQGVQIALDEGGALEEIEREIAAGAELGKYGEFRAAALGLFREVENAGGVAFKVADGWVELGEGYLHSD